MSVLMLRRCYQCPSGLLVTVHRAVHQGPEKILPHLGIQGQDRQNSLVQRPKDYAMSTYRTVKGYYDEFTGMPTIEAAQQEVVRIQTELDEIQNQKTPIKIELQRIRDQQQHLNHSLQMCKKQDSKYLTIMSQIAELNHKESVEQERYDIVEEEFRALFTKLMLAFRKSTELEKNQTVHFKYFSWIFSMVCGGLTVAAFMFKYLTQTAEFREMKQTMDAQGRFLEEAEKRDEDRFLAMERLLLENRRVLDQLVDGQRKIGMKSSSSNSRGVSGTLYDWMAWACSPLKFW